MSRHWEARFGDGGDERLLGLVPAIPLKGTRDLPFLEYLLDRRTSRMLTEKCRGSFRDQFVCNQKD